MIVQLVPVGIGSVTAGVPGTTVRSWSYVVPGSQSTCTVAAGSAPAASPSATFETEMLPISRVFSTTPSRVSQTSIGPRVPGGGTA